MVSIPRQSRVGFPVKLPRSAYTQERVFPVQGYTDAPDLQAGPASIISGQNIWLYQGRITPRPRLQQLGTNNPLGDTPTGAFLYYDVEGSPFPIVASKGTISVLNAGTWTPLVYASGTSNNPPSGGANDLTFGTSVYLPRVDQNVLYVTNGVDPVFTAMPSQSTTLSTATQGLIAKDIVEFDTRLVYWNVRYVSSTSQLVTRVAWTVKGNPEDQTSVGAGFTDLFDMAGHGTRIFPRVDEIMLATDQEIWRGRAVGPPFDFQFDPFSRTLGIPYPRAAINTPDGLFWVGADLMVYKVETYYWSQIEPIGKAIQRTLHNEVGDPNTLTFGYHADAKQLTLYYKRLGDTLTRRGWTLNTLTGTWTPELYTHGMNVGFTSPVNSSGTQWNQLVGSFAAQTLTYNQLLGVSNDFNEATVSSGGTVYIHAHPNDQATDDGTAVYEEVRLGPLFAPLAERRKFLDEIRIDAQADLSSTLTVLAQSGSSSALSSAATFALSVGSTSSQYRMKTQGISDVWHTVTVQSTGGSWNVHAVTARAKIEGEAI